MEHKRTWAGVWACVGMLILILDGKTAILGAGTGVGLCITTVIPALFPFMVLSGALMDCSFGFLRPLGRLCRVPKGAEQLLIPAFLGGYPVGAQSVANAWRAGQLNKGSAERMLAFCNNAGPSFLFGMIAPLFPSPAAAWALWGIHVWSALLTARLIPADLGQAALVSSQGRGLSEALRGALRAMATVCGWVVLFRVVIAFLQRWVFFFLPIEVQVGLTGLLELTNGCCQLPLVESDKLRSALCAEMLAAGGLCVTMQTVSVTEGLSLRYYLIGKGLQTAFSLALVLGWWFVLPLPFLIRFLLQKEKKAGKMAPAGI